MGKVAPSSTGKAAQSALSKGIAAPGAPQSHAPRVDVYSEDEVMMSELERKPCMHAFTKWFKPSLYNAGAAPTLGEGSARIRSELLKLAAKVVLVHDFFGLCETVDQAMTDKDFERHFEIWLKPC